MSARSTAEVVSAFNEAFARHDVDGVMALMTEDCVFENTYPAPDGVRLVGKDAVRDFWREFFAGTPEAAFDAEDAFYADDRATVCWTFRWNVGHVRGVDVFRVRDGLVAEKLAYVKG